MDLKELLGKKGESRCLVQEENTAERFASGTVPVFGTPALVGLMEQAALNVVSSHIPDGQTTVGTGIELKHLAPTPIGMTVRAVATLVEVDGRRLLFRVEAFDECEKVGEAVHERYIVDLERFLKKASSKVRSEQTRCSGAR
ncbi:MAG TPA: thioesterase family protein [Clostridia bacterium]|nr:thioesterase family protein [Clostridia bacterium]